MIARCSNADDVADAIRYARQNELEIAVRGGAHNYAGHAVCDGADLDEERVRASYRAEKYKRLAQIKTEWDPHNVFHRNANIRPG